MTVTKHYQSYLPATLAIFVVACVVASEANMSKLYEDTAKSPSPESCCPCEQSPVWALLSNYAVTAIRTIEVFIRGFLLGFGATLLKDLLIEGKRDPEDRINAVQYGKFIGLGMGCALVGMSVIVPTRLQEWVMENRSY